MAVSLCRVCTNEYIHALFVTASGVLFFYADNELS